MSEGTRILLQNGIYIFFNIILCGLIIARAIVSWLPINPSGTVIAVLRTLTDPILLPIRNMVDKSPLGGGGMILDFSPIIALFLLQIISRILIYLLGI